MKIISWNVHSGNGNLPEQLDALLKTEGVPDVLCLQEVSQDFLGHLGKHPSFPYLGKALDYYDSGNLGLSRRRPTYLVTLSKYPFTWQIQHCHERNSRPYLAYLRGWHECLEHQAVDVQIEGATWRIVNLHIGCADTFENKMAQFEKAAEHIHRRHPTIMCGDFNMIATPRASHLPHFLWRKARRSYSITKVLEGSERELFQKRAAELNMHDAFRAHITHPGSGLSLDKVLVPAEAAGATTVRVLDQTFGSDHFPLVASIDPCP